MPYEGAGATSASVRHLGWRHLCFQKRKLHLHLDGAPKSTPNTGYLVNPHPNILYDARSLSPLAQVDLKFMTWWPAGGWVWSAPRNLVTCLPFFLTVLCNTTQNRCTIQCYSRRKPDTISQLSNTMSIFWLALRAKAFVPPPQGLNPWEDTLSLCSYSAIIHNLVLRGCAKNVHNANMFVVWGQISDCHSCANNADTSWSYQVTSAHRVWNHSLSWKLNWGYDWTNVFVNFSQSTKSKAWSKQNLMRSSPLNKRQECWSWDPCEITHPLHSFSMASSR